MKGWRLSARSAFSDRPTSGSEPDQTLGYPKRQYPCPRKLGGGFEPEDAGGRKGYPRNPVSTLPTRGSMRFDSGRWWDVTIRRRLVWETFDSWGRPGWGPNHPGARATNVSWNPKSEWCSKWEV